MTETELILKGLDDVRDSLSDRIAAHEALSQSRHEYLDHLLRGNGNPGIITRLDRVEQLHGRFAAFVKWALGVVGGALVIVIGKLVTH